MTDRLLLLWDNFGPLHLDRIAACQARFADRIAVQGIELCGRSDVYDWHGAHQVPVDRVTLFPDGDLSDLTGIRGGLRLLCALLRISRGDRRTAYILCHWNLWAIFVFACWLRLRGRKVFTMGCSKFDDKPRRVGFEWLKSWGFLPYSGALGSGWRSRDYFRFMGLREDRIAAGYNTVSHDRLRHMAGLPRFADAWAGDGAEFETRAFLCVARLVPKKNLSRLIAAYAAYAAETPSPRRLEICGSGPLEDALKAQVSALGLEPLIQFHGFLQSPDIARKMASALALILPSTEEQFGNVVAEALAFGLPVLVSAQVGACDDLVRSGCNGVIVHAEDEVGIAEGLAYLTQDRANWLRMRKEALARAPRADVARFAEGVAQLLGED